jgi:hypothetical protein
MLSNKYLGHKLFLLFIVMLVLLSGCGLTAIAKGTPVGTPNSIQIKVITPDNNQVMTLTDPKLIQRLYQLVYKLPQMPPDLACTMELGPHYMLTFRQNNKILGTALAKKEGCRPVTISGEKQDRQATTEFWSLLDQAILSSSK